MSVEQQATRVASGAKSALKALIQKLGGTVPDSTKIDGFATIVNSINLGDKFMLIPANPTTHDILWYDENTESWVLANLSPATIGAAASGHTHTKAAITDFPTSMPPAAHKASHKTGGSDALAPADIGAAAASHTHTKANITDFPSSMTPSAHKASHKTGGSDALSPADIGAAAANHSHNYLPITGGTLTGNLTGQYLTGTWLQTTSVGDKAGNFATIDGDGWIYYRTPAEVRSDIGAAAASHSHAAGDITSGTLPLTRGGTGATTATAARSAMGAQATVKTRTGSLTVAGWSSKKQTISVTSVSASNCVIVAPAPDSLEAYVAAGVRCTAQASGRLTFTCQSVPTAALTVNVAIL